MQPLLSESTTPGTFHSLLPDLDVLLSVIHSQSTALTPISQTQASEAVVAKVSFVPTARKALLIQPRRGILMLLYCR